ncbi:hypothetical protein KC324_g66 [Hortaea werneckii]|nr:hypothetical protein KC324_g66 [Hortaea werneckii]
MFPLPLGATDNDFAKDKRKVVMVVAFSKASSPVRLGGVSGLSRCHSAVHARPVFAMLGTCSTDMTFCKGVVKAESPSFAGQKRNKTHLAFNTFQVTNSSLSADAQARLAALL